MKKKRIVRLGALNKPVNVSQDVAFRGHHVLPFEVVPQHSNVLKAKSCPEKVLYVLYVLHRTTTLMRVWGSSCLPQTDSQLKPHLLQNTCTFQVTLTMAVASLHQFDPGKQASAFRKLHSWCRADCLFSVLQLERGNRAKAAAKKAGSPPRAYQGVRAYRAAPPELRACAWIVAPH